MIGFLSAGAPGEATHAVAAFHQGLKEMGYLEGQNVAIEYRWAEGQHDRQPALAADLVRRQVAVTAATGGTNSSSVAKAATSTIPIIFGSGEDPVKLRLVASLNRPGGNATGVSFFASEMEAKRLGLLRELIPTAALVAVLLNPDNTTSATQLDDIQEAARVLDQKIHMVNASNEGNIHAAFATFVIDYKLQPSWSARTHSSTAARIVTLAAQTPPQSGTRGDVL
jgi:putative tryptophan/tyrosine transport system substrate-binding protein